MVKKIASRVYMGLIFLFLYLPILVLIVLSFNNSKSKVKWGGFTLDWYIKCFQSERIMSAFSTTLQLSLIHISEPTRRTPISYAVFCLKKKTIKKNKKNTNKKIYKRRISVT